MIVLMPSATSQLLTTFRVFCLPCRSSLLRRPVSFVVGFSSECSVVAFQSTETTKLA